MGSKTAVMRLAVLVLVSQASWACAPPSALEAGDPGSDDAVGDEPRQAAPLEQASPSETFVHVGGVCSTGFAFGGKKTDAWLGAWPNVLSVDAAVDQRESMAAAVGDLQQVLDQHCRGDSWCYLYAYSNGGAVVSKLLSLFAPERWNLLWATASGSNEGGSELSGGLADIGELLGATCELATAISPSDHRAGWNHNDTAGNTVYQLGGFDEWWYTGGFPDFFGGSANDGAVAAHSSAGLVDTYYVSDDDPWLCFAPDAHWDNHEIAYRCEGYDLDHYGMKMQGIFELEG